MKQNQTEILGLKNSINKMETALENWKQSRPWEERIHELKDRNVEMI